jgi:hypothetical protein
MRLNPRTSSTPSGAGQAGPGAQFQAEPKMTKAQKFIDAIFRWLGYGVLIAAAICLVVDLFNFHYLADLCQGVEPRQDGYCTGLYNIVCGPSPADCPTTFPGYLAPQKFDFRQIVLPDWGRASVLGYGWFVLQLLVGTLWNSLLFSWYVARMPFVINPLLWVVLLWLFSVRLTPATAVNPLLKQVLEQRALGDAATATPSAVHQALLGRGSALGPEEEFEN